MKGAKKKEKMLPKKSHADEKYRIDTIYHWQVKTSYFTLWPVNTGLEVCTVLELLYWRCYKMPTGGFSNAPKLRSGFGSR